MDSPAESDELSRSLRLATDIEVQDVLCQGLARDCETCASAKQAAFQSAISLPTSGSEFNITEMVPVRCQWVAPMDSGSNGACIALDAGDAMSSFSSWLRKHEGLIDGKRSALARPSCRLLVREASECAQSGAAQGASACAYAPALCGACTAQGANCGFCGERVSSSVATASLGRTRCVRGADGHEHACATRCDGFENNFDLGVSSSGQGLIEYPFWGRFGLVYAKGQSCQWKLGGQGGSLSLLIYHDLANYDAVHISDATLGRSELPTVVNHNTVNPLKLTKLATPVLVAFFSDGSEEAVGFSLSWVYAAPTEKPKTQLPQSVQGPVPRATADFFNDVGTTWTVVYIVVATIGVLTTCACFAYCLNRLCRAHRDQMATADASVQPPQSPWLECSVGRPEWELPEFELPHRQKRSKWSENPASAAKCVAKKPSPAEVEAKKKQQLDVEGGQKAFCSASSRTASSDPRPPLSPPPQHSETLRPPRPLRRPGPSPEQPQAPEFPPPSQERTEPTRQRVEPPTTPTSGRPLPRSTLPSQPPPPQRAQLTPSPPPELPSGLPDGATAIIVAIRQEMAKATSDADRKALMRELQRLWHPDKNPSEQKVIVTAVFQYINGSRNWFLAPSDVPFVDDVLGQ